VRSERGGEERLLFSSGSRYPLRRGVSRFPRDHVISGGRQVYLSLCLSVRYAYLYPEASVYSNLAIKYSLHRRLKLSYRRESTFTLGHIAIDLNRSRQSQRPNVGVVINYSDGELCIRVTIVNTIVLGGVGGFSRQTMSPPDTGFNSLCRNGEKRSARYGAQIAHQKKALLSEKKDAL